MMLIDLLPGDIFFLKDGVKKVYYNTFVGHVFVVLSIDVGKKQNTYLSSEGISIKTDINNLKFDFKQWTLIRCGKQIEMPDDES